MPNLVVNAKGSYVYRDRPVPKPRDSVQTVLVEIYYEIGGNNWFSGTREERGIYISVTPVTLGTDADGRSSTSTGLFAGIKDVVLPLQRKSAVKLADVVRFLDAQAPAIALAWRTSPKAASQVLRDLVASYQQIALAGKALPMAS